MKRFLLLLCTLTVIACAGNEVFKDGFDSEKTWIELQAQLPAYPKPENLLPFNSGPVTNNQYFVDAKSIQIGTDGVARYSLVVKSSTGAMNVSFEGIRCETKERKRYALGRDDGTWAKSHITEWQLMENLPQFYAQRELARYYLCPLKIIVSSPQEAISALKSGIHPRVKTLSR
ncbi:MAG: CNP1-like family protein [Nitrosomonas sp.]|nr:CNP1-like family protein [Nitrosomonas sp.]MDP1951744.1 CNP1-like family protein [Nitrosomonas sp.]